MLDCCSSKTSYAPPLRHNDVTMTQRSWPPTVTAYRAAAADYGTTHSRETRADYPPTCLRRKTFRRVRAVGPGRYKENSKIRMATKRSSTAGRSRSNEGTGSPTRTGATQDGSRQAEALFRFIIMSSDVDIVQAGPSIDSIASSSDPWSCNYLKQLPTTRLRSVDHERCLQNSDIP